MDEGKLHQLVGQMLNDLGGAASVAMVRMGDALGLYKTLHEKGSTTCDELASAANVHRRYLRECPLSRPCCSPSRIVLWR